MVKRAKPSKSPKKAAGSAAVASGSAKSAAAVAAPPVPVVLAPDPRALQLFQEGVTALQRHAYESAAASFQQVLDGFPAERALLERARVYLDLCEREARKKPSAPRTIEERVTAATAALNNDDDAEAERLARSVLESDDQHDLALYLMAALEARRGDADGSLAYLSRAVAVSPEVRAQAKHDADFAVLRETEAFKALMDPPPTAPAALRRPLPRRRA